MKTFLFIFHFFIFSTQAVFSQNIQGKITDSLQNEGLEQVHIWILGTSKGTVSDNKGEFTFNNMASGTYTLRFSAIGFKMLEKTIELKENATLEIALQPDVMQLNQIMVVSTQRYEKSQFESAESVTSINQLQILQDAPRSTPELLMGKTGAWIQKTNHGGGSPFIRGLTGNQVLMMIDGIRLNNSTYRYGPNQYLSTIDPFLLERVEIVRGSGSVQYGSDALGGTVQLLSKNPMFSSKFRVSGNTYLKYMSQAMEKTGRAEVELSSEKIAFIGGITYSDYGDLVGGEGIGTQAPSGYKQLAGDAKLRVALHKNHLLTFAYQGLEQKDVPLFHRVKLEDFAYNQFNPQQRQLAYTKLESFYTNKWLKQTNLTLLWSKSVEGRQYEKNNATSRTEERDAINTNGLVFEILSEPTKNWKISSGFEYYYDKINSAKTVFSLPDNTPSAKRGLYPDDASANNWAAFTLHTYQLQKFHFTAGLRFNGFKINVTDENKNPSAIKPNALVGNAAVAYYVSDAQQIIASFNTAFRAPNIDDLSTLGVVDFRYEIPNFDLKPEKSYNFELGYKAQFKNFAANISFYRNQLQDLILRVRSTYNGQSEINGNQVYTKENAAKAYIQGFETDFEWLVVKNLTLKGNLTYTFGENETGNEPLRRIPPMFGGLYLRYQYQTRYWASLHWSFAGRQDRLAAGDKSDNRINPNGTPAWNVFNLQAGYQWKFIHITASLQNILNEAYRTHGSGIDGYGRSFWAMLGLRF